MSYQARICADCGRPYEIVPSDEDYNDLCLGCAVTRMKVKKETMNGR